MTDQRADPGHPHAQPVNLALGSPDTGRSENCPAPTQWKWQSPELHRQVATGQCTNTFTRPPLKWRIKNKQLLNSNLTEKQLHIGMFGLERK